MINYPALIIDTATPTTAVAIALSQDSVITQASAEKRRADDLLLLLEAALTESHLVLSDLQVIIVRTGIGSYTGLRVGVSVATTLSWSQQIPLVPVTSRATQSMQVSVALRLASKSKSVEPTPWPQLRPHYQAHSRR